MICFYYLSIITYNKKDEYIKRKLEPWFHVVPIILTIAIGTIGLIMKQYNNNGIGGNYHPANYNPPHCQGVANGIIPEGFKVPCGRGDTESGNISKLIIDLMPVIFIPAIIIGTMYRTVRKIERKMRNYGTSALRRRASQLQPRAVGNPNAARLRENHTAVFLFLATLKIKLLSICPCACRNGSTSRSNNARGSQKRAVLYMAMSYSLTCALMWIPFYINQCVSDHKATRILHAIFQPLQGLYNLVVYMSPKVRNARNMKRGKLPWRQAITKAWMSKGEKDQTIVCFRHNNTSSLWQRLHSRIYLDSWI